LIAALLERYKRSIGYQALSDKLRELNDELLKEVNERMLVEEKLRRISIIDDLTGLYNRRGFFELAEKQLAAAMRNRMKAFLFFMDLDNLKKINDVSGHKEGDNALLDASIVIKDTFRQSDIIARIGGDEFAVFSAEEAEDTAGSIISRLQNNIDWHNKRNRRPYELSISTGYVICDDFEKCSIGRMMEKADKSMYQHKLLKNQMRAGVVKSGA
jgi:diguanylate cyclase (GGDEF)-like protein